MISADGGMKYAYLDMVCRIDPDHDLDHQNKLKEKTGYDLF